MFINSRLRKIFDPKRRSQIFVLWLSGVIVYDGIRAIIVNHFFSKHGLNGWDYFVFELVFSVFFAWTSFQLVLSAVDNKPNRAWAFGALTLLFFFAPDAYIVIVGNGTPTTLYIGLALYLSVTTFITIRALKQDIHSKRTHKKSNTISD